MVRLRGGGTGDISGAGAAIAIGRSDGVVTVYDGSCLAPLVSWTVPPRMPVHALDVSPCTSFLVAGAADGVLAVFALPAFTVATPVGGGAQGPDLGIDGGVGAGGSGSGAASSGLENLLDAAASTREVAREAAKHLTGAGAAAVGLGKAALGAFGNLFKRA